MKNRQSGFTLMELLTTVVIAGIVLGLGVPSFTRLTAGNRVADQTNDLVGAITLARSESIRRNAGITLCRAVSDTATDCDGTNANWENWIIRTGGGEVIRRGVLQTYGNTLHVSSSMGDESILFSPDGLARTGGVLVNADPDNPAEHWIAVCSTRLTVDNFRRLTPGSGSRITTARESGTCT